MNQTEGFNALTTFNARTPPTHTPTTESYRSRHPVLEENIPHKEDFQGEEQWEIRGTRACTRRPDIHHTLYEISQLDPIYPCGLMLNLDILDFKNREVLVDDWASSMGIAVGMFGLNKE